MKKLIKLVKSNLLGIAVAIGVISFLYEAIIQHGHDYTFTQFSILLIIILALRSKYQDNLAKQKSLLEKSLRDVVGNKDSKENSNI